MSEVTVYASILIAMDLDDHLFGDSVRTGDEGNRAQSHENYALEVFMARYTNTPETAIGEELISQELERMLWIKDWLKAAP